MKGGKNTIKLVSIFGMSFSGYVIVKPYIVYKLQYSCFLQRTVQLNSCNFIYLAVNEGKGHAMHIISSVLKIL